MLQRDYIQEIVEGFSTAVAAGLGRALEGDPDGCAEVELQIGELLELDHTTALGLAPDSLVTMMVLSGMGDTVAGYVRYALDRLALVYERRGESDLAGLRRLQARAVAESFAGSSEVPRALAAFDAEAFS